MRNTKTIKRFTPSPTNQATSFVFTEVSDTSLRVSCTRGNGRHVIIFARLTATTKATPVNQTTYTANAEFGSGTANALNYCVYKGKSPDEILITGLSDNTSYSFDAYEFNFVAAGSEKYNISSLTDSQTTLENIVAPTTQATNLVFEGAQNLSLTRGNGLRVLVLAKSGSAVDGTPVDGTTYTAHSTFGSGSQIGTGNYVVFDGTASSFFVRGLPYNTDVHFRAFEYNISDGDELYFTDTATGNPLNHHTISDVPMYLSQDPIAYGLTKITGKGTSKAYTGFYVKIPGYHVISPVSDNQHYHPEDIDESFLWYKADDDGLDFDRGWTCFVDGDGEPIPLIGRGVENWDGFQNWAGQPTYFDVDNVVVYFSANATISGKYSIGRAVIDFTDFPNTFPTVTRRTNPVIQQGASRSMFQFARVFWDEDEEQWMALLPNVQGVKTENRSHKLQMWRSTDGLTGVSFDLINDDVTNGTGIEEGGHGLFSHIWKENGRHHWFDTAIELPDYQGSNPPDSLPVYRWLNKQIIEVSDDLTSDTRDFIIERVVYETEQHCEAGIFPSSPRITHNGQTHIICSTYLWKVEGFTTATHQLSLNTKVLSTAAISSGTQVGNNVFPSYVKRWVKMHQTHLDDEYAGTIQPIELLSDSNLTVVNTPTQFSLNKVVTENGYVRGATFTHDQENFAVMTFLNGNLSNSGYKAICWKEGTFEIRMFDEFLEVWFYGSGSGVKKYRTTTGIAAHRNGKYFPAHNAVWAIINRNGSDMDVTVGVDYDTVATTAVQTATFTSIAQTSNPDEYGRISGLSNYNSIMGDTIYMWGSGNATKANLLKQM